MFLIKTHAICEKAKKTKLSLINKTEVSDDWPNIPNAFMSHYCLK